MSSSLVGPTLKVMRIQSPSLASFYSTCTNYPTWIPNSIANTMLLPDSFGTIHVGETFHALLSVTIAITDTASHGSAVEYSSDLKVNNLIIDAYLQTPSQRHRLAHSMDASNQPDGSSLPLHGHADVTVSRILEEVGPHILRVEIAYHMEGDDTSNSNSKKVIRKFYRFQVSQPLQLRSSVFRQGDVACIVSVEVKNILTSNEQSSESLIQEGDMQRQDSLPFVPVDNNPDLAICISSIEFIPEPGLAAELIAPSRIQLNEHATIRSIIHQKYRLSSSSSSSSSSQPSALDLYDSMVRLRPKESHRYLFRVHAASESATIRGIACGDIIGKVEINWRKSLGDTGVFVSPAIYTPPSMPPSLLNRLGTLNSYIGDISKINERAAMEEMDVGYVVHGSGLSVDTAAAAASFTHNTVAATTNKIMPHASASFRLDEILPLTVEPLDPPTRMILGSTYPIELLIVNHGPEALNAYLQMRLSLMKGVVISGPSSIYLGEIPPNGGSTAALIHLLALLPGLFQVRGCFIVDPLNGREIAQPPLFSIYVQEDTNSN